VEIDGDRGGKAMNEERLSHIPFRVWDELMILSMARWMKFVGLIKVAVGVMTMFVMLVGLILIAAEMGTGLPELGKTGKLIAENRVTFFALEFFALVLAVTATALGFVLYQAAEHFEHVIRTDEADQDYMTAGLIQLKTYFKVSILLAIAAVVLGIA